jgi:hypothetical protein
MKLLSDSGKKMPKMLIWDYNFVCEVVGSVLTRATSYHCLRVLTLPLPENSRIVPQNWPWPAP